jgi:ketosteroid isomerase-like protein
MKTALVATNRDRDLRADGRKPDGQRRQVQGRTAWTDVLLNRDGRWQIVAEHGSQLSS